MISFEVMERRKAKARENLATFQRDGKIAAALSRAWEQGFDAGLTAALVEDPNSLDKNPHPRLRLIKVVLPTEGSET